MPPRGPSVQGPRRPLHAGTRPNHGAVMWPSSPASPDGAIRWVSAVYTVDAGRGRLARAVRYLGKASSADVKHRHRKRLFVTRHGSCTINAGAFADYDNTHTVILTWTPERALYSFSRYNIHIRLRDAFPGPILSRPGLQYAREMDFIRSLDRLPAIRIKMKKFPTPSLVSRRLPEPGVLGTAAAT